MATTQNPPKDVCAFVCNGKMQNDTTTLQSQLMHVLFKLLQPSSNPTTQCNMRERAQSHRECRTPCHPRTLVFFSKKKKNGRDISVARSGSTVAFSGSEWLDSGLLKSKCGFRWLGLTRQWFWKTCCGSKWLDSGCLKNVMWLSVAREFFFFFF